MLRGAEHVWPPSGARAGARADGARRSVAVPNGEGVASGSATEINSCFNIIFAIVGCTGNFCQHYGDVYLPVRMSILHPVDGV